MSAEMSEHAVIADNGMGFWWCRCSPDRVLTDCCKGPHLGESVGRECVHDDTTRRHQRNGHTLHLDGCMWRCLQCDHTFDAAVDAESFWCGDDCTDRHPGQPLYDTPHAAHLAAQRPTPAPTEES